MAKANLTAERLRELFNYDPDAGILISRKTIHKRISGAMVGTVAGDKYGRKWLVTRVDGRIYLIHRLIWLHVFGTWPAHQIDHINGDATDNRINNMRDVPAPENAKNLKMPSTNKSGITGVNWRPSRQKWRAYIQVNRISIHLGYFDSMDEAAKARASALNHYAFNARHGT